MADCPKAMLIAISGKPNRAAITIPAMASALICRALMTPKKTAPATMPPTKNCRTAMICSAVFAASATLTPNHSMVSIIKSIPKVISGPGSTRVNQSNRSKGIKGKPAN